MNNQRRTLKIGVDYHGVISDNPAYFRRFCQEIINRGHELHILSGGPQAVIKQSLAEEQIKYTALFTILDYYAALDKVYVQDGQTLVDMELWNKAKAEYCLKHGINIQIDDSLIYGQYFQTPYCLYSSKNGSCILSFNEQIIDLHTLPPEQSVIKLEQILG